MKLINYLLFILFTIFINSLLFAQLEATMTGDGEAFARGRLIEFGITSYGVYGATVTDTPTGYHDNRIDAGFGFISNSQDDGWVDYDGDFFMPGSPEEGFCIEIDGANYCNNKTSSLTDIVGTIESASVVGGDCSSSFAQISWSGSIEGLTIERTYKVSESGLFIQMETSITNTTDTVVPDVFWMHNIDPDNNQTISGGVGYPTDQNLIAQASSITDNISHVIALQEPWGGELDTDGSGISFYSKNELARVSYGGFANRNASDIWFGIGDSTIINSEGATNQADEAISIAFNLGNIEPTETKSFQYWYVTGLTTEIEYFTGIEYSAFGTNLTDPEASDGMITIFDFTPDETYSVQYDYNGTTIDTTDYIVNVDGRIIITDLDGGTYNNIIITYGDCVYELPNTIILTVTLALGTVLGYEVCDDDYDGFTLFDLTTKDDEILGDLEPTEYTISYYINEDNAMTGISAIELSIPFTNVLNPQTIWARVEHIETGYFNITSFNLIVLAKPDIPTEIIYRMCDDNYDQIIEFNLESKVPEIIGDLDPDEWYVNFYETEALAEEGYLSGILVSPYTNIHNPQTIWNRVINIYTGCYEISVLHLDVIPLLDVNTEPDVIIEIDEDDGAVDGFVSTFNLNDAIESIMEGYSGSLEIVLYESLDDAENEMSPIPEADYINYSNDMAYLDYIWAVVTDPYPYSLCPVIVEQELVVHDPDFSVNEIVNNLVSTSPNPFSGIFEIKVLGNYNSLNISITNTVGKIIYKQSNLTMDSTRVDLSNHQTGVYFLKINIENKQQILKLILID